MGEFEFIESIRRAFEEKGVPLRYDSPTNQQFPILPRETLTKFRDQYAFSLWEQRDDGRAVVRFCTSWATREEHVEALVRDIGRNF